MRERPAQGSAGTGDSVGGDAGREPARPQTPGQAGDRFEPGGDPVCWLPRVCPECGAIADEDPPATCPRCGEPLPAG